MKKMIFPVITGLEDKLPYYTNGVGIEYEQEDINRPNGHPEYQWIQTRSGSGELFLNGKRHILTPSQGMLLFPNEPHSYHTVDQNWDVDWIIFHGKGVESFIKNTLGATESNVYYISSPAKISTKLEELYYTALKGPRTASKCSRITYDILLDIMELTSKSEKSALDDKLKRIEPVINFIIENYKSPITLHQLSHLVQMTP
ncbi:MAG: AraC family ligand binding domain-containing protein [Clostridia bacterium]|nr:AraC family ligand binding domain-containing protein [Clostridia bacterium]